MTARFSFLTETVSTGIYVFLENQENRAYVDNTKGLGGGGSKGANGWKAENGRYLGGGSGRNFLLTHRCQIKDSESRTHLRSRREMPKKTPVSKNYSVLLDASHTSYSAVVTRTLDKSFSI